MEDSERVHPVAVQGALTLGLPSNNNNNPHLSVTGGAGGGSGREECWSEGATNTLIDAWGERYLQLNRGNLKQKHWREVADAVNARGGGGGGGGGALKPRKTDVQCKNRLDTLKKKFKVEKNKVFSGAAGGSSWPFYAKLDELIGPSRKHHAVHLQPQPLQTIHLQPLPQPQSQAVICAKEEEVEEEEEGFEPGTSGSRDTTESCPNVGKGGGKKRGRAECESPLRELASAIMKFGEVYERMESAKQQQMIELERQRMEFSRDLEVQRLQLYMQTQIELAKLQHGKNGSTERYL